MQTCADITIISKLFHNSLMSNLNYITTETPHTAFTLLRNNKQPFHYNVHYNNTQHNAATHCDSLKQNTASGGSYKHIELVMRRRMTGNYRSSVTQARACSQGFWGGTQYTPVSYTHLDVYKRQFIKLV